MHSFRRRSRPFVWLVLVALFGLALAPTVSHALALSGAPGHFNPWAEICSAVGLKANSAQAAASQPVDAGTPTPASAPMDASHGDHCPLCGQTGHCPALPHAQRTTLLPSDGADFLPALFGQAPRPLFAWAAPQPRGPPSLS